MNRRNIVFYFQRVDIFTCFTSISADCFLYSFALLFLSMCKQAQK